MQPLRHDRLRGGGGQTFESPLRHLRIAETPGFLQNSLHALVKTIRKVPQDVATLMDLAALDLGQGAEHLSDRGGQRLCSIDHKESFSFLIETPIEEISDCCVSQHSGARPL